MQEVVKKLLLVVVLLVGVVVCDSDVATLTDANFDTLTASGEWLLEFYAPWCGHCKNLAPTYEELATKVKGQFNIGKVDCTVEKGLASRFAVRGYPTIKFLKDGQIYDFSGARSVVSFVDFMEKGYPTANKAPLPAKSAPPAAAAATEEVSDNKKSDVVILDDSNFEELTSKGTWLLEFYAPWCGHCKRLAPVYEQVATALKGVVHVGKVDCTLQKVVCSQYDISGYPTIYYKKDNQIYSYEGPRALEDFKKFVETGWKSATPQSVPEPLSGLQAYFQSLLGAVENLSVNLYLVIGVCVVVGLALGVAVVCLSPSPTPNKTIHYTPAPSSSSPNGDVSTEEVSKND